MTALSAVAFIAFGLFAIGDWISRARDSKPLEYVCKPAALVALVVAAASLDPTAGLDTRRAWFVAALVLSLAGDVFLMFDDHATRRRGPDLFVFGLGSFLLAHVCYVIGFWADDAPTGVAFAIAAVVVLVVVVPIAMRVVSALRSEPELRVPVTLYIAVISLMLASALATKNVLAAVGASLFVASDTMIAWNRFVKPFAWASVAIMVTYHLGQAGLVASLLR